MTHATKNSEPITSDPVVIEASDVQEPKDEPQATVKDDLAEDEEADVGSELIFEPAPRVRRSSISPPPPPPGRAFIRGRSPPYRNPNASRDAIHVIANTKQFNAILSESDICIETPNSSSQTFVTTHPFHSADLKMLSWLFSVGIPDAWVQKPTSFVSSGGFQFDLPHGGRPFNNYGSYDDGFSSRDIVSIAKLGAALNIFKDDSEKYGTSKVKFVTAVQGKTNGGWVKLIVSHTRQSAAVDIFLEILNNSSIVFVGAVLQNVTIPSGASKNKSVKVEKVCSVKEAEEVGKGVIGVIC